MYCLLSLPFLTLDIFLGAGRSWQSFLLINISCEGPFSENFYSWNGYNLEPSSVYFHHVPSLWSLWRLDFSKMFYLSISQIKVSVLPVSIVDRASIWKIWSLTWFQCIHYYILRYQMLWQDSRNKTWLNCINMSYLLDKSMKRRTLSNKHVFLRTEQDMNCTS